MWLIIILIITGVVLLIAELVLLPGLTIAGIGALLSYGGAVYTTFAKYGMRGVVVVSIIIVAISIIAVFLSLRAKTWNRIALNHSIDSSSQEVPSVKVSLGERGVAQTRLAPIGRVEINNETYEAKSMGDMFVDHGSTVEVVGFENFSVIVKKIDEQD